MVFIYFELILYFLLVFLKFMKPNVQYYMENGFLHPLFLCSWSFYWSQLITDIETVVCLTIEALKCVVKQ
jgi:hypothetical protein